MYNSNRWIPIKTLNKGVTMLTIKKKFPITKPYVYGLSAFVVGYGAVMYGLITLPQRVDYDSLATLGINIGAVKDVKVESAAETAKNDTTNQPTNAGMDVADQPSTATPTPTAAPPAAVTPATSAPVETPVTTPVVTVPEIPVDPTLPVEVPPITDPIEDLVNNTIDAVLPL